MMGYSGRKYPLYHLLVKGMATLINLDRRYIQQVYRRIRRDGVSENKSQSWHG